MHGPLDPFVERASLLPEAVVPLVLALRQIGAFRIVVETRLRENGNALARELSQTVHRTAQEVGVGHYLVVVEEHHRVEPERARHDKTEVTNGAVTRQAHFTREFSQAELLHALLYQARLRGTDDRDVQPGKARGDGLSLLRRLVRDGGLRRDDHDDLPDALDLGERFEATRQLAFLRQGRRVVVRGDDGAALALRAR